MLDKQTPKTLRINFKFSAKDMENLIKRFGSIENLKLSLKDGALGEIDQLINGEFQLESGQSRGR